MVLMISPNVEKCHHFLCALSLVVATRSMAMIL
jgi:hypothetical protein